MSAPYKKIIAICLTCFITNSFALSPIPIHCPQENYIRETFYATSITPSLSGKGFNLSSKILYEKIDWQFVVTEVLAKDEEEAKEKTKEALVTLELKSDAPIYFYDPKHDERSESWKCDYTIHFNHAETSPSEEYLPKAFALYVHPL